ncbi:hypothetical protein BDW02DRAFT_614377 [Decorospora gaudefroyi]|uniref:BTB domain-containing protein n=1 Tax=Decorospora gaudefroyi TaxID=184978 RepID=A0A6A5KLC8_9PLEO|nr:hypothetical protein BDW02DRAFT_614377 [Decorospora gaudefroyi]
MLNFLKMALGPRPTLDRRSSSSSALSNGSGLDIRVGKPPHARPLNISRSALKACPVLRARLGQGSTIMNADPVVFEIILDYLDSSGFLEMVRPNSQNPLEYLIGGSDMMLKLAKAWHIADMLDLMHLQNKLVDTYRILYLKLLNSRIRMPLDREPFTYLRNHMGTHTKLEKFLIDIYAGLARYDGNFSVEELDDLPNDIAQSLKQRRAQLVVQGNFDDRIAIGDACFKVSKSDETRRTSLHVTPPPPLRSTSNGSLRPQSGYTVSTVCSMHSPPLSPPTTPISSTSMGYIGGHRVRLSLSGITSISGQPDVLVSPSALPAVWSTFGTAMRPARTRSTSTTTLLQSRAPFMDRAALASARQLDTDADGDSSDDETSQRSGRKYQSALDIQEQ